MTSDTPRSEYDRRQAALLAARADVIAALADVRQIRASLGLPAETDGEDLGQVPPDLDQTFSSVLQAQAGVIQSAAQLGVIHSFEERPKQMLDGFEKEGDINSIFARLAADAPDVKQAEAKLEVAKRDLAQAELDLRLLRRRRRDRWRHHAPERQSGRQVQVGQSSHGDPLAR